MAKVQWKSLVWTEPSLENIIKPSECVWADVVSSECLNCISQNALGRGCFNDVMFKNNQK